MLGPSGAAIRSLKSGPITPLIERWRLFKKARPEKYGGSYAKNMLAEAPHLYFFGTYFLIALVKGIYDFNQKIETGWIRPYKHFYHVIRPDDPYIKHVQREYYEREDNDIYDISAFKNCVAKPGRVPQ